MNSSLEARSFACNLFRLQSSSMSSGAHCIKLARIARLEGEPIFDDICPYVNL
jgi:hypothetical protein